MNTLLNKMRHFLMASALTGLFILPLGCSPEASTEDDWYETSAKQSEHKERRLEELQRGGATYKEALGQVMLEQSIRQTHDLPHIRDPVELTGDELKATLDP